MQHRVDVVVRLDERLESHLAGAAQQRLVGADVHLDFALARFVSLFARFCCVDVRTLNGIDTLLGAFSPTIHSIRHVASPPILSLRLIRVIILDEMRAG